MSEDSFAAIVVGTDGSETANQALAVAVGLARSFQAQLSVVSAYEPPRKSRLREESRQAPPELQWLVNPQEQVEAGLQKALDVAGPDLSVQTFARPGDPADAITAVAQEQSADLIVIGNKGIVGVRRFLVGSVPNKVLQHAPCSVLIVKTT